MSNVEDMKDARVPQCLHWTYEDVAKFVEDLGYPDYADCFLSNKINGRRLIIMEACALPSIGINDWEHIKVITKSIREQLTIEDPYWNRSISLPPKEDLGMYLQRKCTTGEKANDLTYEAFMRDVEEYKWQPPLSNHCLIIPHN